MCMCEKENTGVSAFEMREKKCIKKNRKRFVVNGTSHYSHIKTQGEQKNHTRFLYLQRLFIREHTIDGGIK